MKRSVLFTCLFLYACICGSQISVDNSVSPEDAMQTLLGENITISNLSFTGFNQQIGTFDCVDCGLDFESGVILASGDVDSALGPNTSGATTLGGQFSATSDPDLDLLNPGLDFHDLVVLEFDFVALGDSVWFDYVWASDEYPEYSGSTFNDTFGFFMSGPGINGPYSNNSENLALIPGTTDGVTINNVNNGGDGVSGPCMNCEYYENNGTGAAGTPEFDDPLVIGYDGYTVGLRALRGGLICGETYHLRIAVADASDNAWDSAVFLRSGSLSSNLVVQVELEIEATTEDGVMNEECGLSTLYFIRPEAIDSSLEFVVEVTYGGDAVNGTDYTLLPESIVFDPGIDTITYILDAFEDGVVEGLESVQFNMENLAVCEGEAVPSFFEFFITESAPLDVQGYDVEICEGASIEIAPIVNGGSGGFVYDWSTTETTPSIEVTPDALTTYTVTLSDTCLASVGIADINVDIAQYPALELNVNPEILDIDCNWFGQNLTMSATGGDGDYTYTWLNGDGEAIGYGSDFYIWDNSVQAITAQVTDGCTFVEEFDLTINNDITPLVAIVPDEITVCEGEFTIEADVSGEEPFFFYWQNNFTFEYYGDQSSMTATTVDDTQVYFSVSDNCGQWFTQNIEVIVEAPVPLEIYAGNDAIGDCMEELPLSSSIISGVEPYTYSWETLDNDNLGSNEATTITLEEDETVVLTVNDACGQEMTDTLILDLVFVPLEIDVPAYLTGDCLTEFEINAQTNLTDNVQLVWEGPEGLNLEDTDLVTYQSLSSGVIEVNGDAGCGNVASASTEVVVQSPPIDLTVVQDTSICLGGTALLSALASGGSGQLLYHWTSDDVYETFTTVSPNITSSYDIEITDECTNQVSENILVEVQHISTSFTTVSEDLYSYYFDPVVTPECDDCEYYWTFSDGGGSYEESPFHEFSATGYIGAGLTVTTSSGCQAYYTGLVNVPPIVFVPNSFTPDNDGVNDAFRVETTGIDEYNLSIFNRWGEVVFQSEDPDEAWVGNFNGKAHYVPEGVYTYVLRYRSLDTQAEIKKGTITVIR